jgi:hypothetical protein
VARTWEYKTLAMTHGRMGVSKGKVNRPNLEEALTTAGQEGWELVHFWPDTSMHGRRTDTC